MTLAKQTQPPVADKLAEPKGRKRVAQEILAAEERHEKVQREASIMFATLAPAVQALFGSLSTSLAAWNAHQGFWESENVGEKIALMHSELSEALEADRKDLPSDHIPQFSGVEEELADALIRIFDFAGHFNLRLAEAFVAKAQFNLGREFKHGKAY